MLLICLFLSSVALSREGQGAEAEGPWGNVVVKEFLESSPARDGVAEPAFSNLLSLTEGGEVMIGWSYTGYVGRLVRPEGLPVGTCPDSLGDENQAQCLLDTLAEILGEATASSKISLKRRSSVLSHEILKFSHLYDGVPVIGGGITFTLDKEGRILSVVSTLLPKLQVDLPLDYAALHDCLEALDSAQAQSAIEEALGENVEIRSLTDGIWVDRDAQSQKGVPVKEVRALEPGSARIWYALMEAPGGKVLRLDEATETSNDLYLSTFDRYRVNVGDRCPDLDCSSYPGAFCSQDYSPYECMATCSMDFECDNLWAPELAPQCDDATDYCGCPFETLIGVRPPCDGGGLCHQGQVCLNDLCVAAPYLMYRDNGTIPHWVYDETMVYSSHGDYSRIKEALVLTRAFHAGFGFTGWRDEPPDYRDYNVTLLYNRREGSGERGDCEYPAQADYDGNWTGVPTVWFCNWRDQNDQPKSKSHLLSLLAHEFGHWLLHENDIPYPYPYGCLAESIPYMFGALLSDRHTLDTDRWISPCITRDGSTLAAQDGWRMYSCGNDSCCIPEMPYSHRSYYDYIECSSYSFTAAPCDPASIGEDCLAYRNCLFPSGKQCGGSGCDCDTGEGCQEDCACDKDCCVCGISGDNHNNSDVWFRFIRIFAKGSESVAAGDYNGDEDITPYEFEGVGNNCAAQVLYSALTQMTMLGGLAEWINALQGAAAIATGDDCAGKEAEDRMDRALDASGFPRVNNTALSGVMEDEVVDNGWVSGTYYPDWPSPYLWAFMNYDEGFYIRVAYNDPVYGELSLPLAISLDGDSLTRPSIVIYKDVAYVFWTQDEVGAPRLIKYYSLNLLDPNRTWVGQHTVDTSGHTPEGAVAVAADDSAGLALVFPENIDGQPTDGRICVSRCIDDANPDGFCDQDEFETSCEDSSTSDYAKGLDNLTAVWAKNVNGANNPLVKSLYILHATRTTATICIARGFFDASKNFYWKYNTCLPSSAGLSPYKSNKSSYPMGLTWRKSAFDNGNYLYMVWHGLEIGRKYIAVAQNLGEVDSSDRWFTLPADQQLSAEMTWGPVSFVSCYPQDYLMGLVWTDSAGRAHLQGSYYRY